MAGSVVQSRSTWSSVSGTSLSLAFTSDNSASNNLWIVGQHGYPGTAFTGCSDSQGNTYSGQINDIIDNNNNNRVGHWHVQNCAAGANTVTLQASAVVNYWGLFICEINTGQNPAYDANAANHQLNPGAGTDAVTSGTDTASSNVFVLAASIQEGGINGAPAAGTGFTSFATGWNSGSGDILRAEYKSAGSGSVAGTFTGASGSNYVTVMIALLTPAPTQRTRRPALHAIEGVEPFPGALDSRGWW